MKKSRLHILQVEDNLINQSIFKRITKELYDDDTLVVHYAKNAHEALQHLSVVTYDIIFVDLRMPKSKEPIEDIFTPWLSNGYGGECVIKYCFDNGIQEHSKVVACSAADSHINELAYEYGSKLLTLYKPFSTRDLIRIINDSFSS